METFVPQGRKDKEQLADLTKRLDSVETSGGGLKPVVQLLAAKSAKDMTQTELHGIGSVWPDFAAGDSYKARQLVRFEGHYYFVLADVVAQDGEDNRPDKDTEHYKLMSDPDKDGVFPFSAPLGDSDAYGKGDRVTLQGVVYVSQVDGNKSIPGIGDDGNKYWVKA